MVPSEQDAQHERGKGIGRNQSAHFGFQKRVIAAVANYQHQFCHRKLRQNNSKNEKDPRALRKGLWLIDPELCNGSRQNQQCDDKIFGWLRLLAAENEKSQAAGKHHEDERLHIRRVFQIARQFASRPATPDLSGGEAAPDESSAFKKIEHVDLLLAWGRRRRAVLLVGADNRADQFMPHNVALAEINSRDSGNSF